MHLQSFHISVSSHLPSTSSVICHLRLQSSPISVSSHLPSTAPVISHQRLQSPPINFSSHFSSTPPLSSHLPSPSPVISHLHFVISQSRGDVFFKPASPVKVTQVSIPLVRYCRGFTQFFQLAMRSTLRQLVSAVQLDPSGRKADRPFIVYLPQASPGT